MSEICPQGPSGTLLLCPTAQDLQVCLDLGKLKAVILHPAQFTEQREDQEPESRVSESRSLRDLRVGGALLPSVLSIRAKVTNGRRLSGCVCRTWQIALRSRN